MLMNSNGRITGVIPGLILIIFLIIFFIFTNYSLSRDDSLDNLDGENTLGFRIKTDNYNAILYLKDGVIKSIRFADNYLYNEGNYISTMQNYIK